MDIGGRTLDCTVSSEFMCETIGFRVVLHHTDAIHDMVDVEFSTSTDYNRVKCIGVVHL